MRLQHTGSNALVAAVIVATAAVLAAGTYWIVTSTVDRMVRKDAESSAYSWASYLSDNLTDIEAIAAGAQPSADSLAFIERAKRVGQVFRFKLFDPNRQLRLVSDELGGIWDNEPSLKVHNPPAAAVTVTRAAHTEVKRGTPPKRPPLYAETYIPVETDGRVVAIAEVYLDQTAKEALFHEQFTWATAALVCLTSVGFAVPGAAFYFRSRQKEQADARVQYLAHHDGLTGALNRATLVDELDRILLAGGQTPEQIAVHYLDLDRFKGVNDTLGHDVGDALICAVADRLKGAVRPSDLIARLGGDEFVVIQRNVSDAGKAEAFARCLLDNLSRPLTVAGHDVPTTASIGVALGPSHGRNSQALLKRSDTALYAAKAGGRNAFRVFDPAMDKELKARRDVERAIREAAASDGFELHFQPLVEASGGRLTGFEALLRLPREDGSKIPPDVFIPLAEEMGLISAIGAWVLKRACAVASTWPDHLTVSVNLSPAQFANGDMLSVIRSALESSGLQPKRLELEITEGLLLKDTEAVLVQLRELKALGVSIAMDDFGTGYSSLSYLWRFPFDKIKVDRCFMQATDARELSMPNILRTIIALGHSLDMKVTAEGVETMEQAELLKTLSCDYIQGYHFGRPMPEVDLAARILGDFAVRQPESTRVEALAIRT